MPTVSAKKKAGTITVVKKMKNYDGEPAFKKKEERALAFVKKHGLPNAGDTKKTK